MKIKWLIETINFFLKEKNEGLSFFVNVRREVLYTILTIRLGPVVTTFGSALQL